MFIDSSNNHLSYKDVLIILTHSPISDSQLVFDESEKLKNKGVEIISIATGSKKKVETVKRQLQVISTSPTHVHSADYSKLWDVVDEVLVSMCGLGKCPACKWKYIATGIMVNKINSSSLLLSLELESLSSPIIVISTITITITIIIITITFIITIINTVTIIKFTIII